MKNDEPETKHLSLAELHSYLKRANTVSVDGAPVTATRVTAELGKVGKPVRGKCALEEDQAESPESDPRKTCDLKATLPGGPARGPTRVAHPEDARTTVYRRSSLVPSRRRHRGVRIALGTLSVGALAYFLYVMGLASPHEARGQLTAKSPPAASKQPETAKAIDPPVTTVVAANVSSARTRVAVDLLFGGDTRAALDAYRRLLVQASTSSEFAMAVRLLERELALCEATGAVGEAQCAGR